ncbi:uncharacterized protein JCM10292_004039 [Rhodotorula paludigena]|uniref:uncharacterized protein n=1 Tax=Rhodotorula paludigena TaxID=86838 RepID=UPI0031814762
MSTSNTASSALGTYLSSAGGYFDAQLESRRDSCGTSVYAAIDLSEGTKVVCCPYSLAVTPDLARRCIPSALLPSAPSAPSKRPARQPDHELMALYLSLHALPSAITMRVDGLDLRHHVYVEHLPSRDSMRTTLYFSAVERELLRGSNLHGATEEREAGWRQEWEEVASWMQDEAVRKALTFDLWLWACTILSSRAFPSSLIDGNKENSTPVLFPGVDMLNHRPTARVTWSIDAGVASSASSGSDGSLTIVLDEAVGAGEQVFNTYGAKSNEELLLGYGFVLPSNPADFLALKLSLPPSAPARLVDLLSQLKLDQLRHHVPQSGEIPPELLAQMRLLVAQPDELDAVIERASAVSLWQEAVGFVSWENELDVLDAIEGMLVSKLQALQQGAAADESDGVRPEVLEMVQIYRQGQTKILQAAISWRETVFEQTVDKAEEAGVSIGYDDDMDDIDEEDEEE